MDEIRCSFCGIEMLDECPAYGISKGSIDESCYGFIIDNDSDWEIYCPDCMNTIDKLMANYKRTKSHEMD